MNTDKIYLGVILSGLFILLLSSCAAEVGSEKWCANMKEKEKADWTVDEATDFAKHCVLK